jgi:O-antigen biosynthesis protein
LQLDLALFPLQLSIIIVNYNVKHFLEQCLYSVQAAIAGIETETIVIDNCSTDNSLPYLEPKFPGVIFISNKENTGFGKACNQGLEISTGKYILFLNPDTIVPEDCFTKCISFFESNPGAGAIGVKMIDGSGKFLKESKRAFPSPLTSLFKLFGLSKLFPRSKTFSRYHLGHLDEDKNNEVDVLAGAFMMIRKDVLDNVGSFDEIFFMYGEDVDLSYRIQKAGYKNYYVADTRIIHFKGESTRKGTMNYVRMFYNAMSVFVRKHYGGSRAGIFNFLIHVAIWFRAGLSALSGFIRQIGLPLIDAALILVSFWLMKTIWTTFVRPETQYENSLLWIAFPVYTLFFLVTAYYAGLYDRWYRRSELVRSMLISTIVLLAGYALLPEEYRFSRGILLFGTFLAFLLISLLRWILIRTKVLSSDKKKEEDTNTVIAGSEIEFSQTLELLKDAGINQRVLGRLAVSEDDSNSIGTWNNLQQLHTTIPFRQVIFCEGTLSYLNIIDAISTMPGKLVAKIHATGSSSIVGSDSKDSSGESVSKENGYKLAIPYNRRLKRLIDVLVSLMGIISFPIQLFIIKKPFQFFVNCISVLFAKKTWIGYSGEVKHMPVLPASVIGSNGLPLNGQLKLPKESMQMMDYWYARDYEPVKDLKMIWRSFRKLGG